VVGQAGAVFADGAQSVGQSRQFAAPQPLAVQALGQGFARGGGQPAPVAFRKRRLPHLTKAHSEYGNFRFLGKIWCEESMIYIGMKLSLL
jgi:hypothetical protein